MIKPYSRATTRRSLLSNCKLTAMRLPSNRQTILVLVVLFSLFNFKCEKDLQGYSSPGLSDFGSVNTTKFDAITENPFVRTDVEPTSTFSIDADGGSYAMVRRLVGNNTLSTYREAIRTEELINYFTYDYPNPLGNDPIAVNGEVSECPWKAGHKLIRIGIKGKPIEREQYPLANFVLLIDVSGSMSSPDKLELLKTGFIEFVQQMRPQDRLAIVKYAGAEGLHLESTPGTQKDKIINAIKSLGASGSTNGAAGIKLAYEIAEKNFIQGGNNRVILGTDGDFNVGIVSTEELVKLIEEKREKGVFLTSLGVGADNLNEAMMEKVANRGNGNYEYIDSKEEMVKVFVDEYNKFLTVAKDVKVQVTFNKDLVEEYRLIGYENRKLNNQDFTDDKKDAGEIGAGQTITAIYQIKPRYHPNYKTIPSFTINFRYKFPTGAESQPMSLDIFDNGKTFTGASENLRFAASLAATGMYLRDSRYMGDVTLNQIQQWAQSAKTFDPNGYRKKHLSLLQTIK